MHGNIKETTHSMFAPCPYFRNLMGGTKKARYLVIIPKVVASSFQRIEAESESESENGELGMRGKFVK